jgi:hypothetical protein
MQKLVAPSRVFSFFLFFFGNGDEVEKAKMFTDAFDHVFFSYTRCPRTRAPEKKGEIFIKGQINNSNEKFFYLERYSRKEQFNSPNQSILSHPGLFPVIVARLHILLDTFSVN